MGFLRLLRLGSPPPAVFFGGAAVSQVASVTKSLVDQFGGVLSDVPRMANLDTCKDSPLSWHHKLVCPFCAAAAQSAHVGDGCRLDLPPLFQPGAAIGTIRRLPDHV